MGLPVGRCCTAANGSPAIAALSAQILETDQSYELAAG
jgi:hypothetical protein